MSVGPDSIKESRKSKNEKRTDGYLLSKTMRKNSKQCMTRRLRASGTAPSIDLNYRIHTPMYSFFLLHSWIDCYLAQSVRVTFTQGSWQQRCLPRTYSVLAQRSPVYLVALQLLHASLR